MFMGEIFHCGNNALTKGDGGAVGLTDSPSTLIHWMVAGPEAARVIEELYDQQHVSLWWGRVDVDTFSMTKL